MNAWTNLLLAWLVDYYLLATVLLMVALVAGRLLHQPAQRDFLATATVLGLIALAILSAAPTWPRISLTKSISAALVRERPPSPQWPLPNLAAHLSHQDIVQPADWQREQIVPAQVAVAPPMHSTPAPAQPVTRFVHIDLPALVSAAFLLGAAGVSLWLLIGSLRARQFCRLAEPAPEFARRELASVSLSVWERAGVRVQLPTVLVSRWIDIAAAWGLLRPTILLPPRAVASDSAEPRQSLRMLLAHEYAHIRRGDLWALAASRLLLVVLFAHPLYWLLRRRMRMDQELLADALAAQECGHHQYAENLYAWARRLPERRLHLAGALGIWQRPGQLSRRIAMLLDERIRPQIFCPRPWRLSASALSAALIAALSLITLRPAPVVTAEAADAPQGSKTSADSIGKQQTPPSQSKPEQTPQAVQEPPEKVAVAGICLDQRKKPIANAQVRLFRVDHSNTPVELPSMRAQIHATVSGAKDVEQPGLCSNPRYYAPASQQVLRETRSDAEGKFRFDDVVIDESVCKQSDLMQIVAQSSGYATYIADVCHLLTYGRTPVGVGGWVPKDAAQGAAAKPLELKLQKAVALKGRIVDEASKPVAGAIVTGPESLVSPVPGVMCAVTDADGRYEINDLPPFNVDDSPTWPPYWGGPSITYISQIANVRHPDYAPQLLEFSKLPATVDAVLERPAALEGRVVLSESGQGVAEARINVMTRNGAGYSTITDMQGRYSLAGLLPGKCSVTAQISERPLASSESHLSPGKNSHDLRLVPGGFLKGRVIDDTTGKPLELHQPAVIATVGEGDSARAAVGYPSYQDGTFSFAVYPGKNQVTIFAGPWLQLVDAERWSKTGIDVAEGQTVEIELRVSPPWLVRQLGKLFE